MDWLRSEDLKEEKNVTTPVVIIAAMPFCRWGIETQRRASDHENAARTQSRVKSGQGRGAY